MSEQEHDLVKTAPMLSSGRLFGGRVETHLRDQLIDDDGNANSADEATQEWSTQNAVQEPQSTEPSGKDEGPCQSSDHTSNLRMLYSIVFHMRTRFDGFFDNAASQ